MFFKKSDSVNKTISKKLKMNLTEENGVVRVEGAFPGLKCENGDESVHLSCDRCSISE